MEVTSDSVKEKYSGTLTVSMMMVEAADQRQQSHDREMALKAQLFEAEGKVKELSADLLQTLAAAERLSEEVGVEAGKRTKQEQEAESEKAAATAEICRLQAELDSAVGQLKHQESLEAECSRLLPVTDQLNTMRSEFSLVVAAGVETSGQLKDALSRVQTLEEGRDKLVNDLAVYRASCQRFRAQAEEGSKKLAQCESRLTESQRAGVQAQRDHNTSEREVTREVALLEGRLRSSQDRAEAAERALHKERQWSEENRQRQQVEGERAAQERMNAQAECHRLAASLASSERSRALQESELGIMREELNNAQR
jgi:hypothetical protein